MPLIRNMASPQAADSTESVQAVDSTEPVWTISGRDLDLTDPGSPPQFHIGHLQSCAPNSPIVDRLVAKVFPRSSSFRLASSERGYFLMNHRKVSAPWRKNCPACGVIAEVMRFSWQDEKLKARSYIWCRESCLFNTQYPAEAGYLQFFTRPGQ